MPLFLRVFAQEVGQHDGAGNNRHGAGKRIEDGKAQLHGQAQKGDQNAAGSGQQAHRQEPRMAANQGFNPAHEYAHRDKQSAMEQ